MMYHISAPMCSKMLIVSNVMIVFLQWSPTEADIFASCSVDGKICIWDIRTGKQPCVSVKAHNADVNVISWNRYIQDFYIHEQLSTPFLLYKYCIYVVISMIRLASCMIASGCDDGSFSIRDLRLIKVPLSWQSTILYACLFQTITQMAVFSDLCSYDLLFKLHSCMYSIFRKKNISEMTF